MKRIIIAALSGILLTTTFSCSRDSMSDLNTNPDVSPVAVPEWMLGPIINGIIKDSRKDVIEKYDTYGQWMQYVSTIGNLSNIYYNANWKLGDKGTSPSTNYNKMYTQGRDIEMLLESVKAMSPEDQAKRQYVVSVAKVLKAYLGWKASDVCGDIPYTEANRYRFGGTVTPKYDSQKDLYLLFDSELKAQSEILSKDIPGQINAASGDFLLGYPHGTGTVSSASAWAMRWAKFANTLRLKIALRYQKRDVAHFDQVLKEVENSIISSVDEEAVYQSNIDFTNANEDDINVIQTGRVASKSFVDYMLATNDPRLSMLVVTNHYGPSTLMTSVVNSFQGWNMKALSDSLEVLYAAGKVTRATKPEQYFVGYTSNPQRRDDRHPLYKKNYTLGYTEYKMGKTSVKIDTISKLETSLWFKGGMESKTGDWRCLVPVLSYADVCFMCAEIAEQKGTAVGGKSAKQWYEDGIKASMKFYAEAGSKSGMIKGEARIGKINDAAINAYIQNPMVAYVAGEKDQNLERIALQAWVHFYRQPEEAWSNWRRTGFPKFGTSSSIFNLEACSDVNGVQLFIPRRAALPKPTATGLGDNTANWRAALANMNQISGGEYFNGVGTVDINEVPSGRVYWDKK